MTTGRINQVATLSGPIAKGACIQLFSIQQHSSAKGRKHQQAGGSVQGVNLAAGSISERCVSPAD